eukprot:14741337-Alexandrium_andersonii.AAC.1
MMLGSGCTSLQHKTATFAYQLYLHHLSGDAFLNALKSVRCVTSDLGVEVGIADWRAEDARNLLPDWLDVAVLRPDCEEQCGQPCVRSPSVEPPQV